MAKKKASAQAEAPVATEGFGQVGTLNGHPVVRMKVKDLTPADYNPREITEKALDGLKSSITEFGLVQAAVWNKRTGNVVGGHQRLKTLDPESLTDVVVVDLDEIREKSLNLALNDRTKQGDWTANVGDLLAEIEGSSPELFQRLALDDLRVEVPTLDPVNAPDAEPEPVVSETVTTKTTCPYCNKSW
jgi:hypothetical protein